jgi:alpha-tubulin suppressor-like RCC1 family protein
VSAGYYHSLALRKDGTVVAWGGNEGGQTEVPAGLSGVVSVSAGGMNSLALKKDGTVVAWGRRYEAPADVVAVAAGTWHSLALKKDGTIVAWGRNDYGETGPRQPTDARAPSSMNWEVSPR